MDQLSRVNELEPLDELMQDVPVMSVLENLLADGIVQVSLHEIEDQI